MNRSILGLTLGLAAIFGSTVAQAAPIGINFVTNQGSSMLGSDSAGVVSQINWNNAAVGHATGGGSNGSLIDSTGTNTGASVSWSSGNGGQTGAGDATGDNKMFKGALSYGSAAGAPGSATINVTGLSFGEAFNVFVFSGMAINHPSYQQSFTIGGSTIHMGGGGTALSTSPMAYTEATATNPGDAATEAPTSYALFTGLTGSAFSLQITAPSLGRLSGIQIVAASDMPATGGGQIPVPAPLALLGIGLLVIARRNR